MTLLKQKIGNGFQSQIQFCRSTDLNKSQDIKKKVKKGPFKD